MCDMSKYSAAGRHIWAVFPCRLSGLHPRHHQQSAVYASSPPRSLLPVRRPPASTSRALKRVDWRPSCQTNVELSSIALRAEGEIAGLGCPKCRQGRWSFPPLERAEGRMFDRCLI